ncbi:hypothetical protein, variant [Verruconis gallopava]|uniref:Endoplasmic oxidoreductin-1 n=1 Tax=Verruconis gallopava TaxID=253628 RepID=A0A0D1Z4N9_9PEZI|nr:hypothetical protein, variant [Verruconis gallopava]KIW07927.1 hypothetical protein, variant [Verruconis gallopava]
MPSAATLFYLAVFSLLGTSYSKSGASAPSKSKDVGSSVCDLEPNSVVSDACASYSTLEDLNTVIHPHLHAVTQDTDFFSHYRLNLFNKVCPFWSDENGMCGNIACAVNTLDNEEDIPLPWRAEELGKLEGPKAQHPGKKLQQERPAQRPLQGQLGEDVVESCVVEYDDECDERDYCIPEDEGAGSKGDYVSLVDNPERFTGYSGTGAHHVWDAIYRENCFHKSAPSPPGSSDQMSPNQLLQMGAANDLRNVIKSHELSQGMQQAIARGDESFSIDELDFDDQCIEKRVFYRVVSGMHASISTHICANYFNQTTGEWFPNLTCYKQRLHEYPERISNLYFNYALLVRAVGKLGKQLQSYTFCSADPSQDRHTKALVQSLIKAIGSGGEVFDETVMFKTQEAAGLKEEFRSRFRNISRVMDCVGCDKCRLWGKLQTNGYGTALKVLFEFDEKNPENNPPIRRTELVALLNTLDRVSHSLQAIVDFRRQIEQEESAHAHEEWLKGREPASKTQVGNKTRKAELLDDGFPDINRRNDPNMTLSEIFMDELNIIWSMYKYVLRSWIEFPAKAFRISIWEMNRFWCSFLGLRVPERNWEWRIPSPGTRQQIFHERDEI